MLIMESAFRMPGRVAAPICHTWLKDVLKPRGLV